MTSSMVCIGIFLCNLYLVIQWQSPLCSKSGNLNYNFKSITYRAGIGHGAGSVIFPQDANYGGGVGRYREI